MRTDKPFVSFNATLNFPEDKLPALFVLFNFSFQNLDYPKGILSPVDSPLGNFIHQNSYMLEICECGITFCLSCRLEFYSVWKYSYGYFLKYFLFKKHQKNIFLFLKNYFWYQHIKMIGKHKKHINLKQRKNKKF